MTLSLFQIVPARLRSRCAVAAFLIAVGLTCSAASDPKAARLYEDALARFEARDHAGAIIQLKNALRIDAAMLPVHVLLGKALLARGDVIAAEVAFDEALRLGVDRAEVVLPLAEAVVAQGKHQWLLDQPRFADAGLPASVRSALLLAKAGAAGDLGDARQALRFIEIARELDATKPVVWL